MNVLTFWDHLFFLLIGIIIPIFSLSRGKVEGEDMEINIKDKAKFYYANAGVLWVGAIVVFILWTVAGRPYADMGIRWPVLDQIVILLTALFIFTYLIETVRELRQEGAADELKKAAPFLPENGREFLHFSFLAFSAGFCEEIVYRGFMVNYLLRVIDDSFLAITVAIWLPAIIFGVIHLYQGWTAVLKISIMSLLFGAIFIWSQSLLIVIILHFLVDLIGGMIGWKLHATKKT